MRSRRSGWDLYLAALESYAAYGPLGHAPEARQQAMDVAEIYARAWAQARAQSDDHAAQVKALQSLVMRHAPAPAGSPHRRTVGSRQSVRLTTTPAAGHVQTTESVERSLGELDA